MADIAATDFLVRKTKLEDTELRSRAMSDTVGEGEVLFKVESFGFTANNVTYAVTGDMMAYWKFFPAEDGWGQIPVWGFGTVMASGADGITPGEKFYGYWPMASHYLARVANVKDSGFREVSPNRVDLPAAYNAYVRVSNDPGYRAEKEAEHMLFQPLFMTSFLIDDFLSDEAAFGADTILISSASSKTSIALAFMLAARKFPRIIGLTSKGNVDFVRKLGTYSDVVTYDDIASMDAAEKITYVDMSGDGAVRADIHNHFKDSLAYDCAVGATHYDKLGGQQGLPGPAPQLFFAPDYAQKKLGTWGAMGLQERVGDAWARFVDSSSDWMKVKRAAGAEGVEAIYRMTLAGKVDPKVGHILTLAD